VVIALIKSGADLNFRNQARVAYPSFAQSPQHQGTPLHLACLKGDSKIVSILIQSGADIDSKTDVSILFFFPVFFSP
jgi:ankyrin repeat protein